MSWSAGNCRAEEARSGAGARHHVRVRGHDDERARDRDLRGRVLLVQEPPYDELDGVISTTSGYTGGRTAEPDLGGGARCTTGHTEAVQVVYGPKRISSERLLEVFWHNIDPVTPNAQFCDHGTQDWSGIFYHDAAQRRLAEESKRSLEASGRSKTPIVTEIVATGTFFPAEGCHQDDCKKNPARYKVYRAGSAAGGIIGRPHREPQVMGLPHP